MSIAAACAENTMNILKVQVNQVNQMNDNNSENFENFENSDCKEKEKEKDVIFFKNTLNDSDDDEMFVIILEENVDNDKNNDDNKNVNNDNNINDNTHPEKKNDDDGNRHGNSGSDGTREGEDCDGDGDGDGGNIHVNKNEKNISPKQSKQPKQKYVDMDVYTHLQNEMESQKMYPLLPCNMISSFARVMEYVEYFDIPSEERKRLVVDLVKILAYSNNDYGSRECFEYFVEHNMIDDIIKTIIDSTKNRYDINRFPHTNRKIVLSCVSLSNKIKITKPIKIESIFEEFKLNLCGLKRFFKMKEKDESKQT